MIAAKWHADGKPWSGHHRPGHHSALGLAPFVDLIPVLVDGLNDPACRFTAGTLVSTPTGLRKIETLKVGDLVLSRSDKTGETAAKPIVSITPAHERRIWTVTVKHANNIGTQKLLAYSIIGYLESMSKYGYILRVISTMYSGQWFLSEKCMRLVLTSV